VGEHILGRYRIRELPMRLRGTERMGGIFYPMRGPLKGVRENYRIIRSTLDPRSPWQFRRSLVMLGPFLRLKNYTMLGADRLKKLYELVGSVTAEGVPGDIVECGVAFGGSAAVMAHSLRCHGARRTIWLLDSFEGLPRPTREDGELAASHYRIGWCKGDAAVAQDMLTRFGLPAGDARVVPGWFEDTLPTADITEISLLHIDADLYASVRLCLEVLYDRISHGGYLVVDDYGSWPGCRGAVDEFFERRGASPGLRWIDSDAVYHVVERASP